MKSNKARIKAVWVIVAMVALGYFLVKGGKEFVLGLDLAGGSSLTYTIKTEALPEGTDVNASVESLRDVVERRVNLFGVREPTVTTSYSRLAKEWRLVIDLPGVTDVAAASKLIGETPVLEFRALREGVVMGTSTSMLDFEATQLTGTYLKKSNLLFDQTTNRPTVELIFNDTGAELFASITKANIGKQIAIFLDGSPISAPNVNEEITGGKAVISGNFSVEEARVLVGRLNSGALPVPIALAGTTVIGPSLGGKAVDAGKMATIVGFALIALFMVLWYRLPGALAIVALGAYTIMMLALFKVIPVTLTAAGLAGFIISLGLAVDANVLTFERMKEELQDGKGLKDALEAGFARAWTSIRDSHVAAIIVSVILFWFGTSIVKGFAFTFFLGAVISLFSAQVITRTLLRAVAVEKMGKISKFLFGSGISR
jgi:preprotein translocase subunit SecD